MNIGILCYPTYGGSGVVATELGKALAAKGNNIHFISYDKPFRANFYMNHIFFHGVTASNYPLFDHQPYESALISKVVEICMYEDLDVLHAHYAIPHASAALFARQIVYQKTGKLIPVVTTLHGTDITIVGKNLSFLPIVTYSLEESDVLTSVSHFLKEETRKVFKIDRDIEVVPNFVNHCVFLKKDRVDLFCGCEKNDWPVLLHTSNFRKVKRAEDVIRVFIEVRKKMNCRLVMVGDGPQRSMCETLCREANVCGDVKFLGKQDNVQDIISSSDVFIFPSESESFGLAALECMACGIPVVTSNAGGLTELVKDNVSGFVCNVGDVQAMAEKTALLLQDKALHKRISEGAYRESLNFEEKRVVSYYEKIYENLLVKS